jgi:hypothetical protein
MTEQEKTFYKSVQKELKDVDFDKVEEVSLLMQLVFESYATSVNMLIQAYSMRKNTFQMAEAEKIKQTLSEIGVNVDEYVENKPLITS